ncbi:antibiotic biosynthesis monooxygenase family protein [Haladaptatus sp. CMAA 1911]|uniref:antibiotic biosynthesis monooxygenase family protein n=1 Tax=unclassified Haladaptatus TaxID=2622732 RepID=UPI0037546923
MIVRLWHGKTPAAKANRYLDFLKRRAIPDYESVDGNRGAYVLRRFDGDEAHFLTLSFWESEAAIERFVGPDIETATYYPEDDEYLLEFEPTVRHYELYSSEE